MPTLKWDQVGQKKYTAGVDKGVLFKMTAGAYGNGVAWNGLTKIGESPDGADANDFYANNAKYMSLRGAENFKGSIEAYTYPDEFAECDGSAEIAAGIRIGQQNRATFGLAYRTILGNDTELDKHGYVIHLIYGATASPSSKDHSTINESRDLEAMSWEISTTPVAVGTINGVEYKPTATLEIDSTKHTEAQMKAIEDVLYGTESTESRLPLPAEVLTIISEAANG